MKFVVELEQEFGIQISDDDIMLPDFKTIGGLSSMIESKKGKYIYDYNDKRECGN